MEPGVCEPSVSRELTTKRLTHTDTPKVICSATGKKLKAIKCETIRGKPAQMLGVIPANPFMTTHAAALPAPNATPPPGVGKACPTIWGEGENEHNKVSAR